MNLKKLNTKHFCFQYTYFILHIVNKYAYLTNFGVLKSVGGSDYLNPVTFSVLRSRPQRAVRIYATRQYYGVDVNRLAMF